MPWLTVALTTGAAVLTGVVSAGIAWPLARRALNARVALLTELLAQADKADEDHAAALALAEAARQAETLRYTTLRVGIQEVINRVEGGALLAASTRELRRLLNPATSMESSEARS